MAPLKHKKKRNVGITYELIIKEITGRLLREDARGAKNLLRIVRKHFRRGSALHAELACYKSLMQENISSQHLALQHLDATVAAAATINESKLDEEFGALSRDLRRTVPEDFYEAHIPDYREFASAYHLIRGSREARGASLSEGLMNSVQHKDVIISRLTRGTSEPPDIQLEGSPGMSRLVMSKMMSRLNEKYGAALRPQQKHILREYAFSIAREDGGSALHETLQRVQRELLESIDAFLGTHESALDEDSKAELKSVRAAVLSENLQDVGDETISRFMKYVDLASECRNESK